MAGDDQALHRTAQRGKVKALYLKTFIAICTIVHGNLQSIKVAGAAEQNTLSELPHKLLAVHQHRVKQVFRLHSFLQGQLQWLR